MRMPLTTVVGLVTSGVVVVIMQHVMTGLEMTSEGSIAGERWRAGEEEGAAAEHASVSVSAVKADHALLQYLHAFDEQTHGRGMPSGGVSTLSPHPSDTRYDKHACVPCDDATLTRHRPHAYILGAEKSGSSALHQYMAAYHPFVTNSMEESYVLNYRYEGRKGGARNWKEGSIRQCDILRLYQRWSIQAGVEYGGEKVDVMWKGKRYTVPMYIDKTPIYLYHAQTIPQRLLCVDPHAKMIVVLRNPVDRAYSHYAMALRMFKGEESSDQIGDGWFRSDARMANGSFPSFEQEIVAEKKRLRQAGLFDRNMTGRADESPARERDESKRYLRQGIYDIQLRQWFAVLRDHFGPDKMMDHILIMESEADRENKQGMYDRVLDFLDLPPHDLSQGGTKEIKDVHVRSYDHAMSAETREDLEAFFRPHNARLHELLSPLGVEISWAKRAHQEIS